MEYSEEDELLITSLGMTLERLRTDAEHKSAYSYATEIEMHPGQYKCIEKGKNMTIVSINQMAERHKMGFFKLMRNWEEVHIEISSKAKKDNSPK